MLEVSKIDINTTTNLKTRRPETSKAQVQQQRVEQRTMPGSWKPEETHEHLYSAHSTVNDQQKADEANRVRPDCSN